MDASNNRWQADLAGHLDSLRVLSGSRLTSALLKLFADRSADVAVASVASAHTGSRFARPSPADLRHLRRVEDALLAATPEDVEWVVLSPVIPFGTHHALCGVDQNRVLSAVRGVEVAADTTVGLALEAAARRRRRRVEDPGAAVSLASFQRVTRGQQFEGADSFGHFALSGLVTTGRGAAGFRSRALDLHVGVTVEALSRLGMARIVVSLSDFTGGALARVVRDVAGGYAGHRRVEIVDAPERTRARGYYADLAMLFEVEHEGVLVEVGDGGMVDWSARLLNDAKERMMISGLGLDRLALLSS